MKELNSLQQLAEYYPARARSSLADLANHYEHRSQQDILEIAAIAADVSADTILNLGLEPESNPLIAEAFRLQYPNVEQDGLVGFSEERLSGLANGIKGKYFEVLVRDRLNSGESLGELRLGPGQIASLAESPTQEGWDLQIRNVEDGSLVEQIQLKASTSMSYIKTALDRYPDIRVAVPSEVDGVKDEILRTDISDNDLSEAVNRQLGEQSEDALTDMLDRSAEWAFDAVPIVSGILVAIRKVSGVFHTWGHAGCSRCRHLVCSDYDCCENCLGSTYQSNRFRGISRNENIRDTGIDRSESSGLKDGITAKSLKKEIVGNVT